MLALDNADLIRGDAANATQVDYTIHGVASSVVTQLADGQLPAAEGTLYTSPAAGTVVTGITLVNTGAGANAVNLYLQPSGGTSRRLIPKDCSLSSGYSLYTDGKVVNVIDTTGKILSSAQAASITSFLEDSPSNGEVTKAPTSNWAFDHNAATTAVHGVGVGTVAKTADIAATKIDDLTAGDDNTDLDTSITRHGLVPKAVAPAAGLINVIGIANAETVLTNKALFDATVPGNSTAVQAAATGTATVSARRDHTHGITAAITDDAVLTVDDAAAADDNIARFTANGIEGIPAQTALSALLAATLLENDAIILDPALSADGKYNGIVETGTAGAALAFGDLCYLAVADSRWELTDASTQATAFGKLGICVLAAVADGNATTMLLWGKVRADTAFPALTVGAPVFISETAGDITNTAPVTSLAIVRIIGHGNTADELFFYPGPAFIELV